MREVYQLISAKFCFVVKELLSLMDGDLVFVCALYIFGEWFQ